MPGTRRWINTYLIKARQNLRQKSGKIPHQVLFSSDKLYQQLSKLLYLCDAFYKFFCLLIIWRIVYGKLLSTHYKCKENLRNRFEIAHHLLFSLLICSANICEFLYNFCYGQIFTLYSKYLWMWINSFTTTIIVVLYKTSYFFSVDSVIPLLKYSKIQLLVFHSSQVAPHRTLTLHYWLQAHLRWKFVALFFLILMF